MAKKIEELLGADEKEKGKSPLTATPDGEEEGNPLEKMDKASKAKPGKDDKSLDDDVLAEMFKTGENTDGMFTPDEKKEVDGIKLHEDEDKNAKLKVGDKVEPQGKYKNKFKNDLLKNPDQYKVNTPRGEMTVSEAIRQGYDPITKRFSKEHSQEGIKEKHLAGLNDADRAALEEFTNPANAQVAPADAEKYGLQAGSPMIRPEQAANPAPGMNPMMGGGAPIGIGGAMPGSSESMAPGATDLSALLGGGQ